MVRGVSVGHPLAAPEIRWEIALPGGAGTVLEISECPRVAPGAMRSVARRADRAVAQREPAANGVPAAWAGAAAAVDHAVVGGGGKQP